MPCTHKTTCGHHVIGACCTSSSRWSTCTSSLARQKLGVDRLDQRMVGRQRPETREGAPLREITTPADVATRGHDGQRVCSSLATTRRSDP